VAREDEVEDALNSLLEDLASIEHERWAHWQKYMHEKCVAMTDGSLVIPPDLARKWDRQMNTPYSHLSEREKESDREQVRRYLPLIVESLRRR